MTAALLHDVVDDTSVEPAEVEATFGAHVAGLVATVTQLSQMNQLMRRKHRETARKLVVPDQNLVRSLSSRHLLSETSATSGALFAATSRRDQCAAYGARRKHRAACRAGCNGMPCPC